VPALPPPAPPALPLAQPPERATEQPLPRARGVLGPASASSIPLGARRTSRRQSAKQRAALSKASCCCCSHRHCCYHCRCSEQKPEVPPRTPRSDSVASTQRLEMRPGCRRLLLSLLLLPREIGLSPGPQRRGPAEWASQLGPVEATVDGERGGREGRGRAVSGRTAGGSDARRSRHTTMSANKAWQWGTAIDTAATMVALVPPSSTMSHITLGLSVSLGLLSLCFSPGALLRVSPSL
jgi:hypothetical protein